MSNMPPLKFKRPAVLKKRPDNKSRQGYHHAGTISAQASNARTAKQIEQATPALAKWYAFIEASRKRVP
jgi:hypothetical protein